MCRQIDEDRAEIERLAGELSDLLKSRTESVFPDTVLEAVIIDTRNQIYNILFNEQNHSLKMDVYGKDTMKSVFLKKTYYYDSIIDAFNKITGAEGERGCYDSSKGSFLNYLDYKSDKKNIDNKKADIKHRSGEIDAVWGRKIDKELKNEEAEFISNYENNHGSIPDEAEIKSFKKNAKERIRKTYENEYGRKFLDQEYSDSEGNVIRVGDNISDPKSRADVTAEQRYTYCELMPNFLIELYKSLEIKVGLPVNETKKLTVFKAAYTHEILEKTENGKRDIEGLNPNNPRDKKIIEIIEIGKELIDYLEKDGYHDTINDIFIRTGISSLMYKVMHLGYVVHLKGGNEAFYSLYKVMKPIIEYKIKNTCDLGKKQQEISNILPMGDRRAVAKYLGVPAGKTKSKWEEFRERVKRKAESQ